MENNKVLLDEAIKTGLEDLKELKIGSEEYKLASDALAKLTEKSNEIESNQEEAILKWEQLHEEKKDRRVKNGLTAASVIGGIGLTIWGTLKSLKFEETGTASSTAGRSFLQTIVKAFKK